MGSSDYICQKGDTTETVLFIGEKNKEQENGQPCEDNSWPTYAKNVWPHGKGQSDIPAHYPIHYELCCSNMVERTGKTESQAEDSDYAVKRCSNNRQRIQDCLHSSHFQVLVLARTAPIDLVTRSLAFQKKRQEEAVKKQILKEQQKKEEENGAAEWTKMIIQTQDPGIVEHRASC